MQFFSLADLLVPVILQVIDEVDGEDAMMANHHDVLWARLTATFFRELLPLLQPAEKEQIAAALGQDQGTEFLAMMLTVTRHPEHYSFLIQQVAIRIADLVDASKHAHQTIEERLQEVSARMLEPQAEAFIGGRVHG